MDIEAKRTELVNEITSAFAGVKLNEGIGIFEAEAIDCYSSEIEREKERKKDIRDDWRDIPDHVIEKYCSVLCFMDAAGLLFAIPAYMIFTLQNYKTCHSASMDAAIFALDATDNWKHLNRKQSTTVAKFLQFVLEVGDDYFDCATAIRAFDNYWKTF